MRIMGRDIEKKYLSDSAPLIVAHPVLVGILANRKNLFYQHGELAVPKQAVVTGAEYIFVPTDEAAEAFIKSGYPSSSVIVTGLCIEPCLVKQAEEAFKNRLCRIDSSDFLTGGFFSSGAEPKPHIEKLVMAAVSVVEQCFSVIVFAKKNRLNFLYTNIGRGHPFYLDGIVELVKESEKFELSISDVFESSSDISYLSWQLAKYLYKTGSADSIVGRMYNKLRDAGDFNRQGLAMRIMGRDIEKKYHGDSAPLIVAHPVLVGILAGKRNLWYQHGELAVPKQAVVAGAEYVFVPTKKAAEPFITSGYSSSNLIVTGLCIEPCIVNQAETAFKKRMSRFDSSDSLTAAFFSSGAEPKPHIEKLVLAAVSSVKQGHKVIMFAKKDGNLAGLIKREFENRNIELIKIDEKSQEVESGSSVVLCLYSDRKTETQFVCRFFEELDFFVAPSHERTNWAMGLGLPMFILEPAIGPFSPLNREILLEAGVAESMNSREDSEGFGNMLNELKKSQKMQQMSESGWGKRSITGFQAISDFLVNKYRKLS